MEVKVKEYEFFENFYLDILYPLGIFGIGCFFLIIIIFFNNGVRLLNADVKDNVRQFIPYCLAAMVAWLIGVSVSAQFYDYQMMTIFVFLLAVVGISSRTFTNNKMSCL